MRQSAHSNWKLNCWAGGPLAFCHTGPGLCATTLHAAYLWLHYSMFQTMLEPFWPNSDTSGTKWPQKKTGKTEKLLVIFWFFSPVFLIRKTTSRYSLKRHAMLSKVVWISYWRIFFTIRSAGAFRILQKLAGTKSNHRSFMVFFQVFQVSQSEKHEARTFLNPFPEGVLSYLWCFNCFSLQILGSQKWKKNVRADDNSDKTILIWSNCFLNLDNMVLIFFTFENENTVVLIHNLFVFSIFW